MTVATGKKPRAGWEVDRRVSKPPLPALVGPLQGLGYILAVPFIGIAAVVLGTGYRCRESLATMWRTPTPTVVDAQKKTPIDATRLRELFQPLVDRIECEFIVVDREYLITQYYLPLTRHDERLEQAVIGRHCFEVSHGRNSPCVSRECECPVNKVLKTNEQVTVKHYHKNQLERRGGPKLVEVTASPVRDSHGNITHVAELICDVANV